MIRNCLKKNNKFKEKEDSLRREQEWKGKSKNNNKLRTKVFPRRKRKYLIIELCRRKGKQRLRSTKKCWRDKKPLKPMEESTRILSIILEIK